MEDVVITGRGVVSPIGVGVQETWASLEARRSGVRILQPMADAGWIAPFGGVVKDFDPKQWVKPRKSLKVMAREIQFAFAAGEQAWDDAGLENADIDPERIGVICGAGLMYCEMPELEASYHACSENGNFLYERWGKAGLEALFPLWMLKYLPNMSPCHIAIRRDARGPNNTVAHGDVSSLLALGEAVDIIRRGVADVVLTGGSSGRMHMIDPLWREGAEMWRRGIDPVEACKPFDARREGAVCGEGAAILVLESRRHAERRGAKPLARVASVACRTESVAVSKAPTGQAIEEAVTEALSQAGVEASDLAAVNAHATGSKRDDAIEAQALQRVVDAVPVTAPKSFFGNLGASGGAVELLVGLLGLEQGVIPPTLNYEVPDPDCPVQVVAEMTPTGKRAILSLNQNTTGQAAAAVIVGEQWGGNTSNPAP